MLKQAQNELKKKFRNSDDLTKEIGDDKIESFGKVLQKFYLKEKEAETPYYDRLKDRGKAASAFDCGLSYSVVKIDREAERRYEFVMDSLAKESGTTFGQTATYAEPVGFKNDDEASYNPNQVILEYMKKVAPEAAAKFKLPPIGENFTQVVPKSLHDIYIVAIGVSKAKVQAYRANYTKEETKMYVDGPLQKEWIEIVVGLKDKYDDAVKIVTDDAAAFKKFYQSQNIWRDIFVWHFRDAGRG